jgi:hypothetical protein
VPTMTEGREAVVPDAAARRLSNQVARVHNGTYGAGIGLRTLVRLASVQMLRAGASPEAVARALSDLVLNCPGAATANPSIEANRRDRVSAMLALTAEDVSDVALQHGGPRR